MSFLTIYLLIGCGVALTDFIVYYKLYETLEEDWNNAISPILSPAWSFLLAIFVFVLLFIYTIFCYPYMILNRIVRSYTKS
jgi:hypothetical protein